MESRVTNVDVTLRDGGYRNEFQFPIPYARRHAELSVAAGFDWVEIGYLNGSFSQKTSRGLTGLSCPTYIESIASVAGAEHTALMAHHKNIDLPKLRDSFSAGARLIRLCVTPTNCEASIESVSNALSVGFEVCINLTRVSRLSVGKMIEIVQKIAACGVRTFYLADSNGHLIPSQVRAIFSSLQYEFPDIALGFHAHNHLGLAIANALAALDAGVTWMDSAIQGMGKGAGNLVAEYWMPHILASEDMGNDNSLSSLMTLSQFMSDHIPESAPKIHACDILAGYFDLGFETQHLLNATPDSVSVARTLSEAEGVQNAS